MGRGAGQLEKRKSNDRVDICFRTVNHRPMKAHDLEAAGQRLYGKSGWKHQLAADLDVSRKTIWAWLNNSPIPRTAQMAIQFLIDRKEGARHLGVTAGDGPPRSQSAQAAPVDFRDGSGRQ